MDFTVDEVVRRAEAARAEGRESIYLAESRGIVLLRVNCRDGWRRGRLHAHWHVRYWFGGRRRDASVGRWPVVPVSEAREAANEIDRLARSGIDPSSFIWKLRALRIRRLEEGHPVGVRSEISESTEERMSKQTSKRILADVGELIGGMFDDGSSPVVAEELEAVVVEQTIGFSSEELSDRTVYRVGVPTGRRITAENGELRFWNGATLSGVWNFGIVDADPSFANRALRWLLSRSK